MLHLQAFDNYRGVRLYLQACDYDRQRFLDIRVLIPHGIGVRIHFSDPEPDLNFWEKAGSGAGSDSV